MKRRSKASTSLIVLLFGLSSAASNIDEGIAQVLKDSRTEQITKQGYKEPKDYFVRVGRLHGHYAITQPENSSIITTIDKWVSAKALPSFVHHEFAHACQMALGGPSRSVFMDEASATLQEILALGQSGTWQNAAIDFQQNPHIPPLVELDEVPFLDANSKFQYGGALFLLFLDQTFGVGDGVFVRKLWTNNASHLKQLDNAGWARVIEFETKKKLEDLILEFANFRLKYPGVKKLTVSLHKKPREIFLSEQYSPLPLGCVVLRFAAGQAQRFSLLIDSPYKKGISFKRLKKKTAKESASFGLAKGSTNTQWQIDDNETLIVSICNLDKDAFLRRELKKPSINIMLATSGAQNGQ